MAQRWRCLFCGDVKHKPLEFESPSDSPRCPRCSRGGAALAPLVDIHFLYPDPDGPILGSYELRYRVACMPGLHALTGQSASDFTPAVTCPRCLVHPKYREYQVQGVLNASSNVVVTNRGGCCD